MSSSSSESSSSASDRSTPPPPIKKALKRKKPSPPEASSDSEDSAPVRPEDSSEDEQSEDEAAPEEDVPVLSHAEQRRQKKKQKKSEATTESRDAPDEPAKAKKQKVKNTAELAPSKVPKRQNSVWVGNLSFKTTPDALRRFFEGCGEITRVHMPVKMASAGPGGRGAVKENRGLVCFVCVIHRLHIICDFFPLLDLHMWTLLRPMRRR